MKTQRSDNITAWLMSAPALILLVVFLIVPFLMAVYLSFTNQRLVPNEMVPTRFVGLENYQRIFDPESNASVIRPLLNNVLFVVIVAPLQTALALGMALLVNQKLPGVTIFRTIYFIPTATVMAVVAVIWSLLYNSPEGIINSFVATITFGAIREVNWLGNPYTAFPAIMLLSIWQGAGYQMLVYLAGLQSIPAELYEAANIDGATPAQQFWSVTLPQLRNTTIFILMTTMILAFQLFDQVYVMATGGVVDRESTATVLLRMVEQGFQLGAVGRASAIAVVFFIIVFILSLIQRRLLPEERAVN
ncbi:MAG: sugar ABC transporter permease [Meiothermus sp.]|nr:sugar ABC transporter permease [Meiothermus sp.]